MIFITGKSMLEWVTSEREECEVIVFDEQYFREKRDSGKDR